LRTTGDPAGAGRLRRALDALSLVRRLVAIDERTTALAAALGAVIVVAAGIPLAAALNIWVDEAFTLHTTGAGVANAFAQAVSFEAQPPLYFMLEAAWRTFDEPSIAFARLPSVLFAAAAVAVIVGAAHRLAPRVPPLAVALVTALNPLVIWAAVEMRDYALVLLFGAAVTWIFFESFLAAQPARRAWIAYVLLAIAGLYTQYYVGFLLVAQAITLLTLQRRAVRSFALAMTVVSVAFVPFLRVALTHVEASGEFVSRLTFLRSVHEIANVVFVFFLPHDISWSGAPKIAGFAIAATLLLGLFAFGRPAIPGILARAVVLQWLTCLVVFTLIFSISGFPIDPVRHLTVVAPSSLLVAYVVFSSLTRRRSLIGTVAIVVYTVFTIATLWTVYRPPLAKWGDWQRVAATVSADDASIPIAVFPAESALPLSRYLPVDAIPIPRPMPFTVDYVRATTLHDESDVAHVLDAVHAASRHLWMVTGDACPSARLGNYNYNCRYLEAYLNRRYRVVRTVVFRGALARLYLRLPRMSSDPQGGRNAN